MPRGRPSFTCRVCNSVMCSDCKLIAAEYEELTCSLRVEVIALQEQIQSLQKTIELADEQRDLYRQWSQIGYPEVIKKWMESEVWREATKPKASAVRKQRKEIAKETREWLLRDEYTGDPGIPD